jgi:hypothetical protein
MGLFAMQAHNSHGSGRRRRSQSATVRLKDTPELRLVKLVAFVFLGVMVLVIIGASVLPEKTQSHSMTAEQERACTRAYLSADAKLTSALCDPANWRQAEEAGSSQASLP